MDFILDVKSGIPFYRQIIQQVEYNMSLEKLKPGDKLPTVRRLAVQLKVNPNTVAKAYTELEIRDFVETQVGSGTFITHKEVEISEIERKKKLGLVISQFLINLQEIGVNRKDIIKIVKNYLQEED